MSVTSQPTSIVSPCRMNEYELRDLPRFIARIDSEIEKAGFAPRLADLFRHAIRLINESTHTQENLGLRQWDKEDYATLDDACKAVQYEIEATTAGEKFEESLRAVANAARHLHVDNFWAGNEEVYALIYGG